MNIDLFERIKMRNELIAWHFKMQNYYIELYKSKDKPDFQRAEKEIRKNIPELFTYDDMH